VGKDHYMRDEIEEMPILPFTARDNSGECPIRCGLDPDSFSKAVAEQVLNGGFGNRVKEAAYDLADLVWDEGVHGTVEVVETRKADATAK
jgi:hypothetical protein